ncbi:KAT8 regulatory NSL complex subunit 1-like protein [Trichonephila clavipes]|nr:KAT8 regulatory NSL complex subunit 1-like protein [Trichonephila clavipes]
MLSPASLRVCCLAVMAPALTKADRRADCLPVVLPFPADPEHRKDKINDFTLAKFPNKFTCLFNRRKHLMQKAWLRACMRNNSEISDKNRYSQFDLRKSLLNSKVRINADSKNKSWHGTNVTVAVADKVRLKYTMNKNNSSLRNMGLARTNTSLGLHSMKRMNRITHLSHRDKGNPSNLIHESGESSPDLPDSTNSELEAPYRIVRIVQPVQGQNAEKVSSSGDLKCDTIPSPVDKQSSDILVSDDTNIPLSSICPIDTAVTLNDSNLCVMLTDSKCSIQALESHNADAVRSLIQESSNELSPKPCNIPVKDGSNDTTVIKGESSAILHQLNPVVASISDFKESELQDSVDCLNSILPLPSLCDVSTQDDITDITTSLDPEASSFSVASPGSPASHHSLIGSDVETGSITSSTLSADASPIPSSVDEGNEKVFITFPDSFLASASGVHKELVAPAFSDALCLTLNSDSAGSDDEMHIMRKTCCPLAEKDLSSFQERVKEQERKITVALSETEALLRKYTIQHVYNEIRTLVQHIQRKLTIPCQRQAKLSGSKPRDLVDKKAELLQNENVKNLSTAALVSLVRKLESGSNTGNLLPHQNVTLPDSEQSRNKLTSLTLSSEEFADVRDTSKVLLKGVKKLLRSADPDLTESSDDGSSDIEMDEPVETPAQKKAIWKFMMERAALASRSTLLVAKIRELENQLRNIANYLRKVTASYGDINFEEPPASASSALSTESAGDASLQTSVKLNRSKALGRPVNGYLDHSSMNSAIHSGTTPGGSEALRLEQKLNNSFTLMDTSESCSRTRALKTSNFHKRKLLVTTGLHLTNSKLAKLSSVSCICNCQDDMPPCVLCTGRYNCIQSVDPDSLPLLDRVSLLDPNFHPLLSLEKGKVQSA